MKNIITSKLLPTLSVPVGLALVLIPFSFLIGWSLATVILFWFIITPALAVYLPSLVSSGRNTLIQSITGTLICYAVMVFMIYDHYQTDMFLMMMISCVFNMIVISVIFNIKRSIAQDDRSRGLI